MNQSPAVYAMASARVSREPWLIQHLPQLDPVARRHFVQLVTGSIEPQSLLIRAIAAASPFQAEPESNDTPVHRIIRDTRLSLKTVDYPFLMQILAAVLGDSAYLTMDQANHGTAFNRVLVGLDTDGVRLPLGFVGYATAASWADEARTLLERLEHIIPPERTLILLADRVHAGDPFLTCRDALGLHHSLARGHQHRRRVWRCGSRYATCANVRDSYGYSPMSASGKVRHTVPRSVCIACALPMAP